MNYKQTAAAGTAALLLATSASAQSSKLEQEISKTSRQIYDDIQRNPDHPHMRYNPSAKLPYVVDTNLIACAEGHATCPEWTTSIVYDPRNDRSYVIGSSGENGKVTRVQIGIVNGKLPQDFLRNGIADSFETTACSQSAEFSIRDVGVNPRNVLGYIRDVSTIGTVNSSSYPHEQNCIQGSEQQKRAIFQNSMEQVKNLPNMYNGYRSSLPQKIPQRKQKRRRL